MKSILITGCSSGFGRLTAETLAMDGHQVFATMRDIKEKNSLAARELARFGSEKNLNLTVIELDVTSEQSVNNGVKMMLEKTGRIDIAINNAGIAGSGLLETFTVEQAALMFDVNTLGPLRVNRAVLPHMRREGSGLIIHISSTIGRIVLPYMGIYCATKAALEAIAESYHYELKELGIESVIIEPGAFPTPIGKKMRAAADITRIKEYGERAYAPDEALAGLEKYLNGPNAPNPQMVADAVKRIIDTPAGKRPVRTVVDAQSKGDIERLNEETDRLQQKMMQE